MTVTRWLIAILLGSPLVASGQQLGETLVVLRRADLISGAKAFTTLPPGEAVIVKEVKGDRLLVLSMRRGWIRRSDVAKPTIARGVFATAINHNAPSAESYLGRAGVLQCSYDFEKAIQDYKKAGSGCELCC